MEERSKGLSESGRMGEGSRSPGALHVKKCRIGGKVEVTMLMRKRRGPEAYLEGWRLSACPMQPVGEQL